MSVSNISLRSRSIELLIEYKHSPSSVLRNRLVQLNSGLVRKIAFQISNQCSEPYEDLAQIGYLGLIRAIERYDPTQGCAFSSFAVPYIRGEMLHFLRDRSCTVRVPRRLQDLQSKGQKVQADLTRVSGDQPTDSEIAAALEVSIDDWRQAQLAAQNRLPLSLDAMVGYHCESSITLGETLIDPKYQSLQYMEEDRQQLQGAMNQLEEKTRAIIECVFFKGLSRKEVAERIGVSPITVTRRIQAGIQQMMQLLNPQNLQTEP
ncbi:MAG: RNA polymerase sigma factor SigF [Cyanobacteria bacterium P01_E01_bin.6]